jgi:tetratricopeptide (TPR) repeat protein
MMASSTAQQQADQGLRAFRGKNYAEAAACFTQAMQLFEAEGNLVQKGEMANNLSVAYLQSGDSARALQVLENIAEMFAQANDQRRQALTLGNQAAALEAGGDAAAALEKYQQCSDILKALGDIETRAPVLQAISQLQMRSGHQLEALATMDAALHNKKKLSLTERVLKKLLRIPFQMMGRND